MGKEIYVTILLFCAKHAEKAKTGWAEKYTFLPTLNLSFTRN